MAQSNDERIMNLKAQIKAKKEELKNKKTRFSPETNCMISLNGVNYNLNTFGSNPLLLIELASLNSAAKDLDINPDEVIISGYSLTQWINDAKAKLEFEKYKAEKHKLDILEKQLTDLLSDDKQTELKIDELAALIG